MPVENDRRSIACPILCDRLSIAYAAAIECVHIGQLLLLPGCFRCMQVEKDHLVSVTTTYPKLEVPRPDSQVLTSQGVEKRPEA